MDRNNLARWRQVLPFFAFFLLLFAVTCQLPFFSDKDLLYSKLGFWLPEHHFSLVLPNELDTGYPPALGYLLALLWKITGRSLFISHLVMLPFTLGIVWQTRNLLDHFFEGRYVMPAMALIMADTTFLSQTILFSTDLVLLFFMLFALNCILQQKKGWLALALTGLLFSHMRGIMAALVLGIFELYQAQGRKNLSALLKIALPYIPSLVLFGSWMALHYYTTGWIFHHADSPWIGCYEPVDLKGFGRNMIIYAWRLADYGKIFLWITPLIALYMLIRGKLRVDPAIKNLAVLLILVLLVNAPTMLFYKILNNHRYLLPAYYLLAMLAGYLLFINPGFHRYRKFLTFIIFAGLISGSFWVYPGKIANGWDGTLAHLPYHHLRAKMIGYIDEQKIPYCQIGSEVPNVTANKFIVLNEDNRSFQRADLDNHSYVFYSNIFNMFTDEEIDELKNNWKVEKEFRCLQVVVTLYRKP